MNKPNFFIIGAPKCGTTALSEYLAEHPQVFMSPIKEPHYFASDFRKFRPYYVQTEQEYLELFARVGERHLVVGEASVWYLYSSTAVKNIHAFDPTAHLVVMLRNPVEMVYALHSQYLFSLVEDVADFERAWRLQEQRRKGFNIPDAVPRSDRCLELLQYGQIGKVGSQMHRVLETFPRSQVKAIFFEDFKEKTGKVYREVLDFLGVPDDGRHTFLAVNSNKVRNSYWFARMIEKAKKRVNKHGIKDTGFLRMFNDATIRQTTRNPLTASFRKELNDYFYEDIHLLSSLLERNLDHWLMNG